MGFPVVKGVSYGLAHAPDLVRYGSKPFREISSQGDPLLGRILAHLRTYDEAVRYAPNQVYVGNIPPDDLAGWPQPHYRHPAPGAQPGGRYGAIISQRELYARMLRSDHFDLFWVTPEFAEELRTYCAGSLGWPEGELGPLKGHNPEAVAEQIEQMGALPLFVDRDRLIGCLKRAHEVDEALAAPVLLENLACKTTGLQALQHLFAIHPELRAEQVDYLIGCGEEAVGDRYQRGGGNVAKAIGEDAGCLRATGSDLKAFCCSPVHALVVAGSLVQAGVFQNVVVLAGCSLAKLGMKFQGHLAHDMPIIEDVLASFAVWVAPNDGVSPQLRLDRVGKHDIGAGSSAQAIMQASVVAPLAAAGLRLGDVDKYAVELHNPEVTEPSGNGNVPLNNYRLLAGMALLQGEITRDQVPHFVEQHGLPGYSPTQGHIASAMPFLAHARDMILAGRMRRAMFVAKGSLFLGRLTQLSDGISIMVERNGGAE